MGTIETIKGINWRDVASRAVWTFAQGFLAVFILSGENIIDLLFEAQWEALLTLLLATAVGGVAAGLSAVKTIVLEVLGRLREGVN